MNIRNKFFAFVIASGTFFSCSKNNDTAITDPTAASTQMNVAYGNDPQQKMDVYLPSGRSVSSTKVIIAIHGGAWALGDRADFAALIDTLKKRLPDYAIFNINYRLAVFGANQFPTQELDTKAAVEYIFGKRNDYFISDKFVLVGASAGAHLALLHAYKHQTPVKIKAVVDFYGPTSMNDLYNNPGLVSAASLAAVVGGTPASIPAMYYQSSPINFVSDSLSCPTIIFQGGADPLVNAARQSSPLRDSMQLAGVPVEYNLYPGKDHGVNWGSETYFDAFNKTQLFLAVHNQ